MTWQKFSLFAAITAFVFNASAQVQLTDGLKDSIISNSLKQITNNYFFTEEGLQINNYVTSRKNCGAYSAISDFGDFIRTLAQDIQHVNHDKHLNFNYTPAQYVPIRENFKYIELLNPKMLNGGITALKLLPGNIGYINLNAFGPQDDTLWASVFTFLKNTSALIIDLRKNGGGMLSNLLSSYLLPPGKIHLNTIFWKEETDSIYTIEVNDQLRYLDKPVYLLTSPHTFSSAEEFTYDLKNLKRAQSVGETTGGGANPGRTFDVFKFKDGGSLTLFVPTGKVENPISKSNWEGKGIEPDITCTSEQALHIAQKAILEHLLKTSNNSTKSKIYKDLLDQLGSRSKNDE